MRTFPNLLSAFFLALSFVAHAQPNLDSLNEVWSNENQLDSIRSDAFFNYISQGFLYSRPDTAFDLGTQLHAFGVEKKMLPTQADARTIQGASWLLRGDFAKALNHFNKALAIKKEIGDRASIAGALINIGVIYSHQGDDRRALDLYRQGLAIQEELDNRSGMAASLTNIGTIYMEQEDHPKALEYTERALEIRTELEEDEGLGVVLMNLGSIHRSLKNDERALDYFNQSLDAHERNANQHGMATCLLNMGTIYQTRGDYTRTLECYERSMEISDGLSDSNGKAYALVQLGSVSFDEENYQSSLGFCLEGYDLAQTIGALDIQKLGCACLYDNYKAMGNGSKALEYHETLNVIADSLNSEETAKKLQLMEFQKQMLADSLIQEEEKLRVVLAHQQEVAKKDKTRNMLMGGGLLLLLAAVGLYSRVRYVRKAKKRIEIEKDRSENLLLNILPAEIAEELKEKGEAAARDFEMVSILFTDFKGFTQVSEQLSASSLVAEINTCFKAFDGIAEKYGIEKIKTIGDAYMAAGGLPIPDENAAMNTVKAGLDMIAFMAARKAELDAEGRPAFEMRVGIHTGPVVAGIVGVKKFQYDIWGDTVNTASRMESSGHVGKVNISGATYALLKTHPRFDFTPRGKVAAKGKGDLEMYFVEMKDAGA